MTNEDDIELDFRPFFDLAMGVLFVLLLLVAAQSLVARMTSQSAEDVMTAEAAAQAQRAVDRETALFFQHLVLSARSRVLDLHVDRTLQAAAIQVPQAAREEKLQSAGGALAEVVGCITVRSPSPGCPTYTLLTLEAIEIDASAVPSIRATHLNAEEAARLRAASGYADLLASAPLLLSARDSRGALAVRASEPSIPDAAAQPVLRARFVFGRR